MTGIGAMLALLVALSLSGCAAPPDDIPDGAEGPYRGPAEVDALQVASDGGLGTGGTRATGGVLATGGAVSTGGVTSTGGVFGTGGTGSTGGALAVDARPAIDTTPTIDTRPVYVNNAGWSPDPAVQGACCLPCGDYDGCRVKVQTTPWCNVTVGGSCFKGALDDGVTLAQGSVWPTCQPLKPNGGCR